MDKISPRRSQDSSKVAGAQMYQVQYAKEKIGSSFKKIKKAIKMKWNVRKKIDDSKIIEFSYCNWQF